MTDWELLDQYVAKGNTDALCTLVNRHIDMVHATAHQQVRDATLKMPPAPPIKTSLKVGDAPVAPTTVAVPHPLAHPRQAAAAALDLVTATRADTGYVTSTLHPGLLGSLKSFESAASALLQTDANDSAAPQTTALTTAFDQSIAMAQGIANRTGESVAAREKSATLAAKLMEIAKQ